jgi:16S rRNA (uracil1498-N3)-methyltransferase
MRVLVPRGSAVVGQRAPLAEEEAHHLRVRRAQEGEAVEVLDGAGLTGSGRLIRAQAEWLVEIDSAERQPVGSDLILAVAAGDRERFTWMAEKAVELGVTDIVPLDTSRTVGVATRLRATHTEKLRRIVLEATKQCGAAWAPEVQMPIPLADFVGRPVHGAGWLADSAGDIPSARLDQTPVTVVIGPEGGFTPEERAAILSSGYRLVVLGSNTLRFETAALAAAAAVVTGRMRGNHG